MAKVLVKANVAYPDDLLGALDSFDRRPHGELHYSVDLDEDAQNQAYMVFTWESLQRAHAFWNSDAAKAHIGSWHAVSIPEFVFLRTLVGESS